MSVLVDHTRVVLKDGDQNVPGFDYINANYISVILSFGIANFCVRKGICADHFLLLENLHFCKLLHYYIICMLHI